MELIQNITRHHLVMETGNSITALTEASLEQIFEPQNGTTSSSETESDISDCSSHFGDIEHVEIETDSNRNWDYRTFFKGSPQSIATTQKRATDAGHYRTKHRIYGSKRRISTVTEWTEYATRKSVVKFRNRKSVTRSLSRQQRKKKELPASNLIQRVLEYEYEQTRSEKTQLLDRFIAVFYCWFFGWIRNVYCTFIENDDMHSFWKWLCSCFLVTCAAASILILPTVVLLYLVNFLATLMNAAVFFLMAMAVFLVIMLGLLAIVNFDH